MLARWLRRTAKRAARTDPLDRHHEALLCDRVRSVSGELIEIAWLLECSTDPDPRPMAELHKLLQDGCESPLYNPDVHESELHATVHYLRSALATNDHSCPRPCTRVQPSKEHGRKTMKPPRSFVPGLVALVLAAAAAGVAPGSAHASGWSIEATPTLSDYTLDSALSAVSCPLATICIAVGDYVDPSGVQQPLTEVWNGSAWTTQQTPRLAGGGALQGVSCTSRTACTAVGEYVDSSGAQATLAEQWNGTAWSIQSTPAITGAGSAVLNDVSCPSAGACTAAGYFVNSSGAQQLLAEARNGSAWTLQTNGFPASGGELTKISCSAQKACTAVDGGTTLVERWNGTVWASQTVAIPHTPVPPSTQLYGVTCTTANLCTAVGYWHYTKVICNNGQPTCSCLRLPYCHLISGSSTLAEQWNGSAWAIETTPGSGYLYDVSCPTATDCTAVGWDATFLGGSGNPIAEEWNGSTWSADTIPEPASGSLQALSCTAAANCVAVGNASNATLAEGWNGTGWSTQLTTNPQGSPDPQLTGVSCPTAASCIAVGQYTTDLGTAVPTQVPLGEGWDGTSWEQQEQQDPVDDDNGLFSGVSCSTATSCIAVGPGFGPDAPFTEMWNGAIWSLPPSPAFGSGVLAGVSCPAVICMAVGHDGDTPIGDLWTGSGWTLQTIPVPAGANTSALSSVSCPTTTDCTAVGDEGLSDPLAENWNGTAWTVQTTPGMGALTGVSCPTTDLCWAVGGIGSMVAEEWTGSAWTRQSLPAPTGATSTSLTGVSCPSASDCVAVGSYTDSQGGAMTLAEQWTGTSWSILPTPNPSDASASYLTSLSCASVQACTAVGYYENTSNLDLTLAETYSG